MARGMRLRVIYRSRSIRFGEITLAWQPMMFDRTKNCYEETRTIQPFVIWNYQGKVLEEGAIYSNGQSFPSA